MHQQTQEMMTAAAGIGDTLEHTRALFHALCKTIDPPLQQIAREAEEALVDETDPTVRAHLDGRVCQRARSAVTHLHAARRDLAALIAAVTELSRDLEAIANAGSDA